MRIDLTNQVILVTGASRGIGREIATQLADAGATIAVHYGRGADEASDLAETIGNGSHPFGADLADAGETAALFAGVVSRYGHVNTVVNNAGIALNVPVDCDLDEWTREWDRTLNVNSRASAILAREAVAHYLERGEGGRIIFIASRAAFRGDTPDYLAYAASKGAMVSMARTLARGYGKQGIKAFTVAPGFVRTDMAQNAIEEYGEGFVVSDLALDRLTEPADVAPFVVLLASGLSDHATGATIDVNAGSYVH